MKSLKPKTPPTIINPQKSSHDALTNAIEESCDKYNSIRRGIMFVFKQSNLAPIDMYEISNELTNVSMIEFQCSLIEFVEAKIEGKEFDKKIAFGKYKRVYPTGSVKGKVWNKILEILGQENIKAIEMGRISNELRTTSMENFIHALGTYIEEKLEVKKDVS